MSVLPHDQTRLRQDLTQRQQECFASDLFISNTQNKPVFGNLFLSSVAINIYSEYWVGF